MNRVLRCYWGPDLSTMSDNRKHCLESIYKNSGIEQIELITPDNFKEYEVIDHPIHKGVQYLSESHKGDYVRAYVTYFYGGGWTDIKYIDFDWKQYYDTLEQSQDKWGIGYQEMVIKNEIYSTLPPDHIHHKSIAVAHFIFKEKTLLFMRYLKAIEKILTDNFEQIKKFPGTVHPLTCANATNVHQSYYPEFLKDYKYPLRWMQLAGPFFGVQLCYGNKIMYGMPPSHNFVTGFNHR